MKRYKEANEGIHAPEEVKKKAVRPGGGRGRARWMGAVAAVLAVAIIGSAVLWPGQGRENGPDGPVAFSDDPPSSPAQREGPGTRGFPFSLFPTAHASTLAQAEYPTVGQGNGRSRVELSQGIRDFLSASSAEFLSGTGGENRVYSPLNVYIALSMLAETTGGNSRQQLLDLLGADSIEALRTEANALWLDSYLTKDSTLLANSLWLRDGVTYNQEPLDILAKEYYASSFSGKMGSEGYNQALRDWLNQQTHGLLKEQAAELELDPDTVIALASTLYFKDAWLHEFGEGGTRRDVFHTAAGDVETDFMHSGRAGSYYWGKHFSAVDRDFVGGGSMWLILPDEGCTAEELAEGGEAMDFLLTDKSVHFVGDSDETETQWPDQKWRGINLALPKFDVSSDMDLLEGLAALGVTDALDPSAADFTPLTDRPMYVGQARHAARVKVDENGCEAAAYTVIANPEGAAPPDEEIDFVLDRPFLFAITNGSGLPLFVGIVNQPNG